MIGRRSTIGLALLCALAFCAFAAQSAMAQVGTKSINTTAVTCVKGGGNLDFSDAHCDEFIGFEKGEYGHVAISNDTTREMEVLQEGTSKLNGTLAGVSTEITCGKSVGPIEKSFLHNVETESKKHTITGTVQLNFLACTVVKPLKCVVKEPIKLTATFEGVEGLNGKNDMGVEFKGEGAEGTLAELTFENKGAEKCPLVNGGKAFLVKGSAIATGKVAQGNSHSGATAVYEDANEMETLEIGLKKASFAGTSATRTPGCGGSPIALTTVT